MKELIRKILKETTTSNELLKIINREGIFSVARLVGGIDNLRSLFKHNPAVLERIGGTNGIVKLSYTLGSCPCVELKFDIIDEHWNKWRTNSWADVNIKYDESKLTKEEVDVFNAFIVNTFDMEGSFTITHFDCPELEKRNSNDYLTLEEINGIQIGGMPDNYGNIGKRKVQQIIDKLNN